MVLVQAVLLVALVELRQIPPHARVRLGVGVAPLLLTAPRTRQAAEVLTVLLPVLLAVREPMRPTCTSADQVAAVVE